MKHSLKQPNSREDLVAGVISYVLAGLIPCLFLGLGIFSLVTADDAVGYIGGTALVLIGMAFLLLLIAALYNKTTSDGEGFTCRELFRGTRRYGYSDIAWRELELEDDGTPVKDQTSICLHLSDGETVIVDKDAGPIWQRACGMRQQIDPADTEKCLRITDESGEHPYAISEGSHHWAVFFAMVLWFGFLAAVVTGFILIKDDPDRFLCGAAIVFCLGFFLLSVYAYLFYRNTGVELYKHGFIYRDWLGRRLRYDYSDAVAKKRRRNANRSHVIIMRDGRKLKIDKYMLYIGLARELKYNKLPEE